MADMKKKAMILPAAVFLLAIYASAQTTGKPLLLQEMTWTDVRDYLGTSDMVIVPMGSTEQHGPHLPLGVDTYLSTDMAKLISARTGVVVAPVVLAGYSLYHAGFPGTLSLKPETLTQVYFETAQMLIRYGFRRIMFFNYHGGNNDIQNTVISRINQETEATAAIIGIGGSLQKKGEKEEEEFFDWHAGVGETSLMLYLEPGLVRMDRAEKPVIRFTPKMEELLELAKKFPDLMPVWASLFATPAETKKGGSSAELSSNGIWSMSDPKRATADAGKKYVEAMVDRVVAFIEAWKQAKK